MTGSIGVTNRYKGNCKGCGECCSRILPLSKTDIAGIRKYVEQHGIEQTAQSDGLTCPYLTKDRKCAVYPVRPDICRAYRCDRHASNDFSPVDKHMIHPPYAMADMREVLA